MTEQKETDAQVELDFEAIVEEHQGFVYNLTGSWEITPTPKRQPRTPFLRPIEITIASVGRPRLPPGFTA